MTRRRKARHVALSAVVAAAIAAAFALGAYLQGGGSLWDAFSFGGASGGATRTVVDSVGREVQIPEEPQAIAALDSFSGDVCVLAGADERLMGAPNGVRSNVMLQQLYPGLSQTAVLSGDTVNIETMAAEGVDVALVRREMHDAGEETAKLDQLGIPYVVVDYEDVEGQIAAIRLVGDVCGGDAARKADEIADKYQEAVDLVEERAALVSDDERVRVYHSINDALLTDGVESLGADWIARCGAVDVSADAQGSGTLGDYSATLEQVYVWDPDVIICNTAEAADYIASEASWAGLSAVEEGRVYNLPVSTSRWGQRGDPETFLGMLWLGKTIYPDLYADFDLKEWTVSYYRDVIGLDVDDQLWERILAGEDMRAQGSGTGGGSGSGGGA